MCIFIMKNGCWGLNLRISVCSKNLLEIVMIRSCSEAACESCGSLMGQHWGKNRHLEPENFSKEIVLRVNLGPLHILAEGLVNEVFEFDKDKSYLRKESRLSNLVSKDLNKSAAVLTFEKKCEEKSHFPTHFWLLDKNI